MTMAAPERPVPFRPQVPRQLAVRLALCELDRILARELNEPWRLQAIWFERGSCNVPDLSNWQKR